MEASGNRRGPSITEMPLSVPGRYGTCSRSSVEVVVRNDAARQLYASLSFESCGINCEDVPV